MFVFMCSVCFCVYLGDLLGGGTYVCVCLCVMVRVNMCVDA